MSGVMIERRDSTIVFINGALASRLFDIDFGGLLKRVSSQLFVEVLEFDHDFVTPEHVHSLAKIVKEKHKDLERGRVFLMGAELEHHVTVLALQFMADGIDTFLLRDLTCSMDKKFDAVHEMRLFSIGVVPTTLGQLLMEWLAFESDEKIRSQILDIMKDYRSMIEEHPA